ncbi:hypothetical protein [Neorhizobium tomejilense]|uniref:hypothetical protein n=1 Tax=Neorhizobium tomejilense TaxID=2093828 RepID=UPI000CF93937|nr:hypothetical protein [Neorhizobium tomejilense]
MFEPSQGIFTVDELNVIRDAHVEWCASRSIEPSSPLGQETVKLIMEAYQGGTTEREALVMKCESFATRREEHVRLGAPAIDSIEPEPGK